MKKIIILENRGKSGIYMITNKLTKNVYIGQSTNLSNRFLKYFSQSYTKSKENLIISRALIKYGYTNFRVDILEYCEKPLLNQREQYYLDLLKPQYNILKIAGSSLGYKHSQASKDKRSKALKGIYVGIKSSLFGKTATKETREKMSLQKKGENNPLCGKVHKESTKQLIREKAINRKHLSKQKKKWVSHVEILLEYLKNLNWKVLNQLVLSVLLERQLIL